MLIVGANAISYVSQQELMAAARAVDHSHQVLYQTERLLSNVKDIGNGLRLYLASGDAQYLERCDEAISALPNDLLTSDRWFPTIRSIVSISTRFSH